MTYKLISADSHFIEPPELWKEGLPSRYQDIAPKLCKDADGGDAWDYGSGEPCPLGEPVLVHYEDLYRRPEPHYIDEG